MSNEAVLAQSPRMSSPVLLVAARDDVETGDDMAMMEFVLKYSLCCKMTKPYVRLAIALISHAVRRSSHVDGRQGL